MTEIEIANIVKTIGRTMATEMAKHITELAENQAKQLLPLSVQLWNRARLGVYLARKETAINRLICQPGFPKCVYLPVDQGRSQPLWKAMEIIQWVDSQQRQPGRPRAN
jgi:hypothetical protein